MKKAISFKNYSTQKILAITICIIFFGALFIGSYVERFRFDEDLRWIYQFGKKFQWSATILGPFSGLVVGIWAITTFKANWKKSLIWLFISLLPLLYFVTMMTIALTKNVD